MSKSILIMETPINCDECNLARPDGNFDLLCRVKWKTISSVIVEEEGKPEWCPLRPLPEKKQVLSEKTCNGRSYIMGYNQCVSEINGGLVNE